MTERRWNILSDDGCFVTLGRASDPSETEIDAAEKSMQASGIHGWLAVMEGSPHALTAPRIMCVRALAGPGGAWEAAVEAFNLSLRR